MSLVSHFLSALNLAITFTFLYICYLVSPNLTLVLGGLIVLHFGVSTMQKISEAKEQLKEQQEWAEQIEKAFAEARVITIDPNNKPDNDGSSEGTTH